MEEIAEISKQLPSKADIEHLAETAVTGMFPRLILFADVINRYASTKLRGKVDWHRTIALILLVTRGRGTLTPSQLAVEMLRSNYSMTGLIDDLEKNGLVTRERIGKDRRTVDVNVTSAGLAYLTQVLEDLNSVGDELITTLTENDTKTLIGLVRVLRHSMAESLGRAEDSTYYFRSLAQRSLGNTDEAMADLEKCIEISQDESLIEKAKQVLGEIKRGNTKRRKPIAVK